MRTVLIEKCKYRKSVNSARYSSRKCCEDIIVLLWKFVNKSVPSKHLSINSNLGLKPVTVSIGDTSPAKESPQEPPPPPPPETPWSEEESHVRHLDSSSFRNTLRKIKHAIVMFYAPWCGHCKSTKPEFVKAAEKFADELMVVFGAVDCTQQQDVCANYDVKGYPTIKYFSYFDKTIQDYSGGRKEADFVSFIHSQMGTHETSQKVLSNQDAGFGANVQLADDSNFQDVIASAKPTFVMFYATWCGHCATVKPAFSRLATTAKDDNIPLNVIAVDAAENPKVADFASVQTLPTFKIYSSGKELAVYEGDRSLEDMLNFCKSYAKMKDEL